MPELKFDRPEPELTDPEDEMTLAAIEKGIEKFESGQGIPLKELRIEFEKRHSNQQQLFRALVVCCTRLSESITESTK